MFTVRSTRGNLSTQRAPAHSRSCSNRQATMAVPPGLRDRALGCFLGACVGDAAGAVLEFIGRRPTAAEVAAALRMPGGGCWRVGPGQVTDDSELALALAHALMQAGPANATAAAAAAGEAGAAAAAAAAGQALLPLDRIAAWYGAWLLSGPFDVGITTRQSLSVAADHLATSQPTPLEGEGEGSHMPSAGGSYAGLAKEVQAAAQRNNRSSLSNGCLMRITPLIVWGHALPPQQLAAAACADASLTHSNPIAPAAVAAYCLAGAHLLRHVGDVEGAIAAAQDWLQQQQPQQQQQQQQQDEEEEEEKEEEQQKEEGGAGTVLEWLEEALAPGPGPDVDKQEGFVRWAFVHAFRSIHQRLPFETALTQVLLRGGDTDTNAAIVGGLVGALHGARGIPPALRGPVEGRRVGSPGRARPEWLQSDLVEVLTEELLQVAPCSRSSS